MSMDQVKATETLKLMDQDRDNVIVYQGTVARLDTFIIYYFADNIPRQLAAR